MWLTAKSFHGSRPQPGISKNNVEGICNPHELNRFKHTIIVSTNLIVSTVSLRNLTLSVNSLTWTCKLWIIGFASGEKSWSWLGSRGINGWYGWWGGLKIGCWTGALGWYEGDGCSVLLVGSSGGSFSSSTNNLVLGKFGIVSSFCLGVLFTSNKILPFFTSSISDSITKCK